MPVEKFEPKIEKKEEEKKEVFEILKKIADSKEEGEIPNSLLQNLKEITIQESEVASVKGYCVAMFNWSEITDSQLKIVEDILKKIGYKDENIEKLYEIRKKIMVPMFKKIKKEEKKKEELKE